MPTTIDRNEVQRLMVEEGALLLEVMPLEEFEAEHIAGASNFPIKEINAGSVGHLDKSSPVIVYCWDMQ